MNTHETNSVERHGKATAEPMPRKLHKGLVAIGVIAFGLIVTDRLLEAFRADDVPAAAVPLDTVLQSASSQSADGQPAGPEKVLPSDRESMVNLQNMIGSRVLFVSAAAPGYVVTEDERRIAVGEAVAEDTTLAGVTTHQVILEKRGDLVIFNLPDPVVQ